MFHGKIRIHLSILFYQELYIYRYLNNQFSKKNQLFTRLTKKSEIESYIERDKTVFLIQQIELV